MTTTSFGLAFLFAIVGAFGCAGHTQTATSAASANGQIAKGFDDNVRRDVETLRNATDKFHDLAAAGAAGYPTTLPQCIADSTMGGMGYHMIDRKLVDEKLDIEHPEMLIYVPVENGKLELAGVEYIVPYRFIPATAQPPRLFGQPLKHYDQYNYWEIHVWAWKPNANGLFADWNPAVKC